MSMSGTPFTCLVQCLPKTVAIDLKACCGMESRGCGKYPRRIEAHNAGYDFCSEHFELNWICLTAWYQVKRYDGRLFIEASLSLVLVADM
jgi:hypothetical protein